MFKQTTITTKEPVEPTKVRMIKIAADRFSIDVIKSYSYDDGVLYIETEEDYFQYNKKEVPYLDKVVKLLDDNLVLNPEDDAIQ